MFMIVITITVILGCVRLSSSVFYEMVAPTHES